MNLQQTIDLLFAKKGKKKKAKEKNPSDATEVNASDTFYGPNTDLGPSTGLDPE